MIKKIVKHVHNLWREPYRVRAYFFYLFHPHYTLYTPNTTHFLHQHLQPGMNIFEWGAGRSTLFFARYPVNVVSIEHDASWHRKISQALPGQGNIDLKLVPPDQSPTTFQTYVNAINAYPDNYFDIVAVDGRKRGACLLAALPKVKPGGLALLDDSQRERYQSEMAKLNELGWLTTHYSYGFNRTTIWQKP